MRAESKAAKTGDVSWCSCCRREKLLEQVARERLSRIAHATGGSW